MRSVFRKPNIKKSVSSRTTGRATRTVRKLTNPTYGKKGTGWLKNPKKALYNKIYNATSYGIRDISSSRKSRSSSYANYQEAPETNTYYITNSNISDFVRECPQVVEILHGYYVRRLLWGIYFLVLALVFIFFCMFLVPSTTLFVVGFILVGISIYLFYKAYQYHYAYEDTKDELRKIDY